MPNYTQASLSDVYAAGIVRGAEFGAALRAELQQRVPDQDKVRSINLRIINLRMGLQQAALEADPAKRDVLLGYLQQTYGLLSAALDPLLRAKQPLLSTTGYALVPVVLSVNGFNLVVNGNYVRLGYALVPKATQPSYSTTILPGLSVGGYAYAGIANTELRVTPNTGVSTPQPFTAFLWVGGQQVGRVDYPSAAVGDGFILLYQGTLYYGFFPATSNQIVAL